MSSKIKFTVRQTTSADFDQIIHLTAAVYPNSPTWSKDQLSSHLKLFPEGQLVAVDTNSNNVLGYAASLIILWDDYEMSAPWKDFTAGGFFTNHDPQNGRTLYGAEIMVHPAWQGKGVGRELYRVRQILVQKLKLLRIRAGARLRDYHKYVEQMSPEEYVLKVVNKELYDSTLSFQLKNGFYVLAISSGYLRHDPESLGHAALIEHININVAKPEDYLLRKKSKFFVEY